MLHLHVSPPDPHTLREAVILPHVPSLESALVNLSARQKELILEMDRKMNDLAKYPEVFPVTQFSTLKSRERIT